MNVSTGLSPLLNWGLGMMFLGERSMLVLQNSRIFLMSLCPPKASHGGEVLLGLTR